MKKWCSCIQIIQKVAIVLFGGILSLHGEPSQTPLKQHQDSIIVASVASGNDTMAFLRDIIITTVPEGVSVELDDSVKCLSPCTLSVAIGIHKLVLKKKGFFLKRAEITVDTAGEKNFSFIMLEPGGIFLTSEPFGASITIDGKSTGITPYSSTTLKPGEHSVTLELNSYKPVSQTLTIAAGKIDTISVALVHTKAYADSVAAVSNTKAKNAFERSFMGLVSAAFLLIVAAMVLIEVNGN